MPNHKIKSCFIAAVSLLLGACGGNGVGSSAASTTEMSAVAQLGQLIFRDGSLSSTPTPMSCASCHDPAIGHAGNFNTPVALGGTNEATQGLRNPPSIRYLKYNSAFTWRQTAPRQAVFFGMAVPIHWLSRRRCPFLILQKWPMPVSRWLLRS